MPWPFNRASRKPEQPGADRTGRREPPPITAADLVVRAGPPTPPSRGEWAGLPPLMPGSPGGPSLLVSTSGSFLRSIAGGRPLLGAARPAAAVRSPVPPAGPPAPPPLVVRPDPGGQQAEPVPPRVLPVRVGPPPDARSYTSVTAVPERFEVLARPVDDTVVEPAGAFGDGGEELPPPIFTSILAAQTGKELSELRPDWTGPVPGPVEPDDAPPPAVSAEPRRKRSLGESRRLGLGPPMPTEPDETPPDSGPEETVETVEQTAAPTPRPPARPAPPAPEDQVETSEEQDPIPAGPPTRASVWYQTPSTPGAAHLEHVPAAVVTHVRSATGIDVGARSVHRGPEVAEEAARLGARAFSRQGKVFVPQEAGEIDTPLVRGLVAHELTHVAQQLAAGGALPGQDTAAGRRLEAEARAVERYTRGDDGTPLLPLRRLPRAAGEPHLDPGGYVREVTERLVESGLASMEPSGGLAFRPPTSAPEPTWRAEGDEARVDAELRRAVEEDLEASRIWALRSQNASDDAERARLDAEERERHRRFVEDHGGQLGHAVGAAGGAGGGSGPSGAGLGGPGQGDVEPAPMAAHEALAGMFSEQGARGVDPGVGGFFGQFGRRTNDEQRAVNERVAEYRGLTAAQSPDETTEAYQTRLNQAEDFQRTHGIRAQGTTPAARTAATTTPTEPGRAPITATPPTSPTSPPVAGAQAATAPAGTAPATPGRAGAASAPPSTGAAPAAPGARQRPSPSGAANVEPAPVAAHEAFRGIFSEQGLRGLDPGLGGFFGQFGLRSAPEQRAIGNRISDYRDLTASQGLQETAQEYQARVLQAEEFQRAQGLAAPATPTPTTPTTPTPTTPTTSTAAGPPATASAPPHPETAPADQGAPAPAGGHPAAAAGHLLTAAAHPIVDTLHQAAAGPAGHAAQSTGGASGDVLSRLDESDLEELSNMLYGRFRTRLRRELLIDRERTGLLTDFR